MTMKILFIIGLYCLLSYPVLAQKAYTSESKKAVKFSEEALQVYRMKDYLLAEELFKNAIKADSSFQEAYIVLGELYWEWLKYDQAVKMYRKGLNIDSTFYPKGYLNVASLELLQGNYEGAKQSYQAFLKVKEETVKEDVIKKAKRGIEQCDFAIRQKANPVDFHPINLGPNVNSVENDYWPSLSADNQTLVITRMVKVSSAIPPHYQEDFYISKRENGEWEKMRSIGPPLNTVDNEGAQSISADGKTMVYTVCNRRGVVGRCDLYWSKLENDTWTEPENMGTEINTPHKETQPSLSADGRTVYFVSDRPGGKGGLDIWKSVKLTENTWSQPVNLGDSINTSEDEMSPFIHQDGATLYFSSYGHLGMGGADIFVSKKNDSGQWQKPVNLGYPINTYKDEIGLIVNAAGTVAYYSGISERGNDKDIFKFDIPEELKPAEVSYMKGKVYDRYTKYPLYAELELTNLNTGEIVNHSFSDKITGEFLICIPTNNDYMLNVSKTGYLFFSENFSLRGIYHIEEPFFKDVPLSPIRPGQAIVLKNIFFDFDSYELLPKSESELNKIIDFMSKNPSIKIQISGHTDSLGTDNYNQQLSENRARAVVNYLKDKGIEEARMSYKGYGSNKPVAGNDTEKGRALNRRTELEIIEN
jgi:hypothetical protein